MSAWYHKKYPNVKILVKIFLWYPQLQSQKVLEPNIFYIRSTRNSETATDTLLISTLERVATSFFMQNNQIGQKVIIFFLEMIEEIGSCFLYIWIAQQPGFLAMGLFFRSRSSSEQNRASKFPFTSRFRKNPILKRLLKYCFYLF